MAKWTIEYHFYLRLPRKVRVEADKNPILTGLDERVAKKIFTKDEQKDIAKSIIEEEHEEDVPF